MGKGDQTQISDGLCYQAHTKTSARLRPRGPHSDADVEEQHVRGLRLAKDAAQALLGWELPTNVAIPPAFRREVDVWPHKLEAAPGPAVQVKEPEWPHNRPVARLDHAALNVQRILGARDLLLFNRHS